MLIMVGTWYLLKMLGPSSLFILVIKFENVHQFYFLSLKILFVNPLSKVKVM